MKHAYPKNPIMAVAWRDGVLWAFESKEIRERFENESGMRLPVAPRSGIETLVDQACGVQKDYFEAFTEWFNVNIWGEDPFAERCECGQTPHFERCPDHPKNKEAAP